jgi:L-seryl-tRNA(Ser) seleniumtransferase
VADNSGLRVGDDIYQSIGVRPIINARGTYTIISGSVMLPEVRAALDSGAQHYVHLDELADAIGARLATLTGAEWGLVTSGCAAALTHRDGGLRGRRQSGSARADPEPGRIPA